ncbi:MAG: hypothetical protein M3Q48_02585, partial [Actinomycetota bacterium]|nr:hypothetical protein [Actinomycetota bacterium]
ALTLSASAAAATGTLPNAVQDPVADAIEQVSGLDIPGGADDVRKDGEHRKDAEHRAAGDDVAGDDVEGEDGEGSEQDNFGAGVSERATSGEPKEDGRAFGESVSNSAPKAPQATERTANRPTATNNPGTTARQSAPTASNNPGTTARESVPTTQPEGTPTAESNPSSDAPYTEQPESTPTATENPGTSARPGR